MDHVQPTDTYTADRQDDSAAVISPEDTNTETGAKTVYAVAALLRKNGLTPRISQRYRSPFDLTANGKRIEVKACPRRESDGFWFFNIHRHGVLNESEVDFYVLRLENVPEFKYALHLVIPAPIGTPTLAISLRSLITRYAKYFNRFDLIASAQTQTHTEGETSYGR